ncbi:MAG: MBOAT family protein [Verrucomicrobia bacterium]|nr:MBOAT family protein [Verrucomicrobiota bacterium]
MSFTSAAFFLFLPVVFALHWAVRRKTWQNLVLLVASYVFYGWWDWRFCWLMLASSLIDYTAGSGIERTSAPRRRQAILATAMSANLLLLGFFKYFNFFADSLVIACSSVGVDLSVPALTIILPVGISFYTFQTMSYTLDIYYGRFRPLRNLLDYLTFVSFFPHLVAGPIQRAITLLPQFHATRVFSLESAREGCRMMLWGLAKKMVVADNLGAIVNTAYAAADGASGAELALATVCFAFQIYCDFSAYSEIAAGIARLFGIQLMRNFAYPYFSETVTEFWRRWHISLTTWLRDYVYIPLGGSRAGRLRNARNLMCTALLSGLWHGAAWHFVAWGGLHGLYLTAERIVRTRGGQARFARRLEEIPGGEALLPGPKVALRMAWTFALVCAGWIFFRADSFHQALTICQRIAFGLIRPDFYPALAAQVRAHVAVLGCLAGFVVVEWTRRRRWTPLAAGTAPLVVRWATYTAMLWAILLFGTQRIADFIYFRF